jgi:hypothetical protein
LEKYKNPFVRRAGETNDLAKLAPFKIMLAILVAESESRMTIVLGRLLLVALVALFGILLQ